MKRDPTLLIIATLKEILLWSSPLKKGDPLFFYWEHHQIHSHMNLESRRSFFHGGTISEVGILMMNIANITNVIKNHITNQR